MSYNYFKQHNKDFIMRNAKQDDWHNVWAYLDAFITDEVDDAVNKQWRELQDFKSKIADIIN